MKTLWAGWMVVAAFLGGTTTVYAVDPTSSFTISGRVVSRTCTFDEAMQIVNLDDISVYEFTDSKMKRTTTFDVAISCGAGVSSVLLVPSGKSASNNADFLNTGKSTGVALRLQDKNGNPLNPDGSTSVSIIPVAQKGRYTFTAGYVALAPGAVVGGSFESIVTLNFNYD